MKTIKQISFYELDAVGKVGVMGGWISFVLFIMTLVSWIFFKVM